MSIRVVGGDFRPGRAAYDDIGFMLTNAGNVRELVPFGAVLAIRQLGSERRSIVSDKLMSVAGGGILGGIAAGALAGGLTGPAGAALGAAAGAIIAVRRKFLTCRIELRDGRTLIATARQDTWDALSDCVARAPIVAPKELQQQRIEAPKLLASMPQRLMDRLPWKKPYSG
jgi:outer membrane lipoprotein SlyB